MKFAVAALIATTSALRMKVQKGCISPEMADEGFKALDTNHNGSLSYDEIKVGLEELAKSQNHTITAEEWKWIEETGSKIDAKTPGKVDHKEFFLFANAVFEHFGLCHLVEGSHVPQECVDHELAREGFKALDTNDNGSLSYDEIKKGLEELAASQNHTITADEWKWIEETGKKIDSKTPGKVDEEEFFRFANAVFRHFGLCHLAREEEQKEGGHENCDLSAEESKEAFAHVDKNGDGTASPKEVRKALKELAEHFNHKLSKDEKKWLRKQFKKDGGRSDGGLDEAEFHKFANAVSNHFDLCN